MVRTAPRPASTDFAGIVGDTADLCRRVWSCMTQLCNPFNNPLGLSACNCGSANCGTCGTCGTSCSSGTKGSCSTGCGCDDVCEPCWYPEQLDDIVTNVCAGSTVRIRFHVFNRSIEPRHFLLAATGPDAHRAFGAPSTLDLGPFENGWLVARIRVPENTGPDCALELLLWVRGCRDHVTSVVLLASDGQCAPQIDRSIIDEHHDCHSWRDHFYAPTPCSTRGRTPATSAAG